MNKTTVILCELDEDSLSRIRQGLQNREEFDLEVLDDAGKLVSLAIARMPCLVIVNPEMRAFNEYDVCKKLIQDNHIPVMLLVERNSTRRDYVDQCRIEDVITKPVEMDNLLNLILKQLAVHQH